MLLTQRREIENYLPTSTWGTAQSLLALTEEEEDNYLVPILGQQLFDYLTDRYRDLLAEHESITPDFVESTDPEIRLIRTCQKVVLYMALANNSGLLAASFNEGGGLNQVSADGFESADKDTVNRFERDSWKKAHRNIDSLLMQLEKDARLEEPLWAEMWKESRYWYYRSDLLFTTAQQMSEYLNIEGSRERFIQLVPDIKYCQDVYITPQVGEELMQALIASCTTPTTEVDDEGKRKQLAYKEVLRRLRTALACYVEHRNPKTRRGNDSLSEGDMSIARAVAYLKANQSLFLPYVESSPFYEPPVSEEVQDIRKCIYTKKPFDPDDPNNSISIIGGLRRW